MIYRAYIPVWAKGRWADLSHSHLILKKSLCFYVKISFSFEKSENNKKNSQYI